jgi:hypothetical protein
MLLTSYSCMSKPVGGRGHVAPYETTHVRVPVPIKDKVERLIEEYRKSVLDGEQFETPKLLFEDFQEPLEIARKIVKQKVSARHSLARLLSELYGVKIKPEDLSC